MSDTEDVVVITATVVTRNPVHAARSAEILARAAAGLVLEGIDVSVSMGMPQDDETDGG